MKNALPASKARQLFEDIAEIKQALTLSNMISEREAAALLGIQHETLVTMVSRGKITEDLFTVSPANGKRFYYKDRLMGLKTA